MESSVYNIVRDPVKTGRPEGSLYVIKDVEIPRGHVKFDSDFQLRDPPTSQ